MTRIEIASEQDRLTVAAILVKNGYTVRQTRERGENKRAYQHFIEYSKPKAVITGRTETDE